MEPFIKLTDDACDEKIVWWILELACLSWLQAGMPAH